ncbi:oligosaccharide repeat unit polymerase [Citrobacter sp. Cpo221]|uniref:O-antigen polymerase n=1 Tax=Citrobacter sp. Cpo221 TaxID=2985155 RepID=UPI0025767510|nr:O-antigen polymerase [Citrobacter sp. Cpo221]MDM2752698.1 oligosaccharide repeat unit polymerase [Citrobacter sp. Cpo221]
MTYLIILFLLCTALHMSAIKWMKCNITSPLSLTLFSWYSMAFVGMLSYDSFDSFRSATFYCLLTWILICSFAYAAMEMAQPNKSKKYDSEPRRVCSKYSLLVIPACIITAYEIYKVGSNGPVNFLLNLRLANIEEDYQYTTFTYMPMFYPIIMAMFASVCIHKSRLIEKVSICTWLILFALGTMGKFAVITPILMFVTIYEMRYGIRKGIIFIYAPLVLAGIIVMHFYRMSSDDSATIPYILGTYIYSPIIAFGTLVDNGINWNGEYTLRFIHAIAFKLGQSSSEPVKTILDYVYVPSPTNVYSVMQPFYSDMGIYGIILGAVIYGCFLSFVYASAKNGNFVMLGIYSIFSVSLITQFMSETIITNLSGNIKIAIFMFIIFKFFTKKQSNL